MAHVGRLYPYGAGRDIQFNNFGFYGMPKNLQWNHACAMTGSLGGGWGTDLISDDAVADYTDGAIYWWWQPPATADPLLKLRASWKLFNSGTAFTSIGRICLFYNGVKGPDFSLVFAYTPGIRPSFFGGDPFIIVSGVGSAGFTNHDLWVMRWQDY